MRRRESSLYETKRKTKTGAAPDLEIAFAPIFAEDSAVVGQLSISRDITERKQVERRLHQQLVRLRLLHQITRAMGERQDLASIFHTVLGRFDRDLPVAFAAIFQWDAEAEHLQVCALGLQSVDLAATMELAGQSRVAVGQNGLRAALQGQTVYEPDTAQAPFPFPHRFAAAGLRSLMPTLLPVEHTVFGLLVVAHHRKRLASGVIDGGDPDQGGGDGRRRAVVTAVE